MGFVEDLEKLEAAKRAVAEGHKKKLLAEFANEKDCAFRRGASKFSLRCRTMADAETLREEFGADGWGFTHQRASSWYETPESVMCSFNEEPSAKPCIRYWVIPVCSVLGAIVIWLLWRLA